MDFRKAKYRLFPRKDAKFAKKMQNHNGDIAAARERNAFIMQTADKLLVPFISPGGMLASLIKDLNAVNKIVGPWIKP